MDRVFLEYYEEELTHIRSLAGGVCGDSPECGTQPLDRIHALPRSLC